MLVTLNLEISAGHVVEHMFSADCEETRAYFASVGARRCASGEALSYSIRLRDPDRPGWQKVLRTGDERELSEHWPWPF